MLAPRPGYLRDGCCVWLDHGATDPGQRFKMFQYFRSSGEIGEPWSGGEVYTSPDGIHWGEPTRTGMLGDNSTFFYNPFRRKWVYSVRRTEGSVRARRYIEHDDFLEGSQWEDEEPVLWAWSDELDEPDPDIGDVPQLYDLNAVAYESVMLGLIAIFRGPQNPVAAERGVPKTNDLTLGFSRDGFHWDRPDRRAFIPATRAEGTWDKGYIHAAGGVCLVVGDLLYFYYGAWSGESPKLRGSMVGSHERANAMYAGGGTGLATLRRDGFASMEAGPEGGVLTTRPVTVQGTVPVRERRHVAGRAAGGGDGRAGRGGGALLGRPVRAGLGGRDGAEGRLDGRRRPVRAAGRAGQVQVPRHQRQAVRLLGQPGRHGIQQRLRGGRRGRRAAAQWRLQWQGQKMLSAALPADALAQGVDEVAYLLFGVEAGDRDAHAGVAYAQRCGEPLRLDQDVLSESSHATRPCRSSSE